jgi:hypothetical protein
MQATRVMFAFLSVTTPIQSRLAALCDKPPGRSAALQAWVHRLEWQ